jgi:Cytochrome c554 and c-prime
VVRSTSVIAILALLAAAPVLAQNNPKHLGVASCSSSVCHGSVTPSKTYDVLLNEYVTWSHEDAHAKAYTVLSSPRARTMASKLGLQDAATAKVCLDCHTDNVAPDRRGAKFSVTDGVGCEACHGGSERWIATHTSRRATYRENIAKGMYPTANLHERATLCLSCHYGTADKFATHRLMAAGHPRLSFELDTFLAIEPAHYRVDANYERRKPSYSRTQTWAYGQLAAAFTELMTLQGPRIDNGATFPELALFNCYACHMSSMHRYDWNHRLLPLSVEPGGVPVNDGHLRMAWIISRRLDPASAPAVLKLSQALLASGPGGRNQIVARSRDLSVLVGQLRDRAATYQWTRTDQQQLLNMLVSLGVEGEFHDYIGAEQAVMAIDGLLIDLGMSSEHRGQLDGLYRLVRNDEGYTPESFVSALRELQSGLDRTPAVSAAREH